MIFARKLQSDIKSLNLKHISELQGKDMEYEDMRSYVRKLYGEADANTKARVEAEERYRVVNHQN